jgi:hypothetical protein
VLELVALDDPQEPGGLLGSKGFGLLVLLVRRWPRGYPVEHLK